jgi:hypothetical protein
LLLRCLLFTIYLVLFFSYLKFDFFSTNIAFLSVLYFILIDSNFLIKSPTLRYRIESCSKSNILLARCASAKVYYTLLSYIYARRADSRSSSSMLSSIFSTSIKFLISIELSSSLGCVSKIIIDLGSASMRFNCAIVFILVSFFSASSFAIDLRSLFIGASAFTIFLSCAFYILANLSLLAAFIGCATLLLNLSIFFILLLLISLRFINTL